jgi:hypothetical protein
MVRLIFRNNDFDPREAVEFVRRTFCICAPALQPGAGVATSDAGISIMATKDEDYLKALPYGANASDDRDKRGYRTPIV